jgi:hypothetical protein
MAIAGEQNREILPEGHNIFDQHDVRHRVPGF